MIAFFSGDSGVARTPDLMLRRHHMCGRFFDHVSRVAAQLAEFSPNFLDPPHIHPASLSIIDFSATA